MIDWFFDRFDDGASEVAFIHDSRQWLYRDLIILVSRYVDLLSKNLVDTGSVVAVQGEYSPQIFALFLALFKLDCVLVPIAKNSIIESETALSISGCDFFVDASQGDTEATWKFEKRQITKPRLLREFLTKKRPGLVLFSSGSTGKPKGMLHDMVTVIEKFKRKREPVRAIPFLMIDHFGGINTIFSICSSLGCIVTVADTSLESVCRAIERHRVTLLPTTPSFLTLLLGSRIYEHYDLGSLRRITYGTEVMPEATLTRLRNIFPKVRLHQTYGLSELGVLSSKSKDDGSLWVKLGGEGFETKVIDRTLWIRSNYAMVGYLNAEEVFDNSGWFNTQDVVEVDGEYLKILGRSTDIINVGGQKVYPSEVESVILELENIKDVAVTHERNDFLGQIVVAKVVLDEQESPLSVKKRVRTRCRERLFSYKVPVKVYCVDQELHTRRHKKRR